MKTARKGFTLIELMVVIVIIGILAAIAIPKLFGMTAKAKASEVGPAAGTWSKLQQTYVMETSSFGSFTTINYTPPESNYFGYTEDVNPTSSAQWKAFVKRDLANTCTASSTTFPWMATFSSLTAGVQGNAIGNCASLTPNFENLK